MEYKKYMDIDPVNYQAEELYKISEEIMEDHEKIMKLWTEDIRKISTPNFDPYSFWGERKINKISKKYADDLANISILIDKIDRELNLRGEYEEQQRYSGNSKVKNKAINEKNFLKEETKKTEYYKKSNNNN